MDFSASTVVSRQDPADPAEWDGYVAAHPRGTCFHLHGWKDALRSLGYEAAWLTARRSGRLVGVLPVALVRSRLFGDAATALPFCSYGGPLGDDAEAVARLHEAALELARAAGMPRLEYRSLEPLDPAWPTQSLYVTFRGPIPAGVEDLKSVPQKRRNMVRKGLNQGLRATVSRDVDRFFHLYAENAREHGTPALPKRFFARLLDGLGEAADVLFVEDAQGRAVSCILSFYLAGEVHAGFAGEIPAARALAANDFKYWSLMRHAASRGCTRFDFGRSKQGTGSFEFKRLWGFEPTPLHYQFPLLEGGEIPQNNPNNPKFRLVMNVWRRLPRFVTDAVGPRIIHGLG